MRERDRNEIRRIAKRHRSAPKIVNAASIPARDDEDAYGNPFLGIPSNRLKYRDIGSDEQADNSTTNRVLAPDAVLNGNIGEQINNTKLPNLNGLNGQLSGSRIDGNIDVSNLPLNIPANNVPNLQGLNGILPLSKTEGKLGAGRIKGKIKSHSQIDWGNKPSVPPNAVKPGYDYRKLDHKPNLKKFLTRADFRADGTLKR